MRENVLARMVRVLPWSLESISLPQGGKYNSADYRTRHPDTTEA